MSELVPSETTRLTITLPTTLVRELDARLLDHETTRGMAIRKLIEAALHDRAAREQREWAKQQEIEQYVRGWREQPQTEEEFGWSDRAVVASMAEIPWDPDASPTDNHASTK